MTSLKTKNICFLAAFLFLSIVPTLAKVVDSVSECKGFLLKDTPPNIPGVLVNGAIQDQNRYKVICQTFNNVPRFLTVYDTVKKIPVFSAYKYEKVKAEMEEEAKTKTKTKTKTKRPQKWMIEPQLEDNAAPKDMMEQDHGPEYYTHQAMDADYKNNNQGYNRGHLFPSSHALPKEDKMSTFTLTNIVPQEIDFNGGRWNTMEQCVKCIMDYYFDRYKKNCFVVVGAKPSDNNNNLNNRVSIPSMMWSAFYCNEHISGAYWSNNDANSTLSMGTLQDLKTNSQGIDAFPGSKTFINKIWDYLAALRRKLGFK